MCESTLISQSHIHNPSAPIHPSGPWSESQAQLLDDHMKFHVVEADLLAPLYPRWRLIDVTSMSKLRPDAHPSEALHDAKVKGML